MFSSKLYQSIKDDFPRELSKGQFSWGYYLGTVLGGVSWTQIYGLRVFLVSDGFMEQFSWESLFWVNCLEGSFPGGSLLGGSLREAISQEVVFWALNSIKQWMAVH